MINVMENKVLGPMLMQQYEKGLGEGMQGVLLDQLTEKFGPLPPGPPRACNPPPMKTCTPGPNASSTAPRSKTRCDSRRLLRSRRPPPQLIAEVQQKRQMRGQYFRRFIVHNRS